MTTKKIHSRKFLNKREGIAAIEVRFGHEQSIWTGGWDAGISINDCHRAINLDFCAYSERNVDDVINKANILIDEITKLRDAMLDNREDCINNIKESTRKRKERIKKRELKTFDEVLEDMNDDM